MYFQIGGINDVEKLHKSATTLFKIKMMTRQSLIILLVIITQLVNGQTDSEINNRFNIRIAPLSLIDFYNGSSYKLGFEAQPIKRFSITGDFGGYFKQFNARKNYTGFNIDLGIRYYLNRNKLNQGNYLSINYFYKDQGFDYHDSIQANPVYYSEYRTQKYVTCVNINYGWLKIYKNRLVIDFFAGIGIRYKKVNTTLALQELEKGQEYSDSQSLYFLVTPGKFIYPNINLGMRIGLRIL